MPGRSPYVGESEFVMATAKTVGAEWCFGVYIMMIFLGNLYSGSERDVEKRPMGGHINQGKFPSRQDVCHAG